MNIDYKNGTHELTEHANAKAAVQHLASLVADAGGQIQDAKLLSEGDELERGGRRYRLTAAGFRRLGNQGGLYELTTSDRDLLGLR